MDSSSSLSQSLERARSLRLVIDVDCLLLFTVAFVPITGLLLLRLCGGTTVVTPSAEGDVFWFCAWRNYLWTISQAWLWWQYMTAHVLHKMPPLLPAAELKGSWVWTIRMCFYGPKISMGL